MTRLTEGHVNRTDTIVLQEEEDGEFISFFSVSEHAQDKYQTQVAEIWLGEYNVEELVRELENWLQVRRQRREAEAQPEGKSKAGAGKPRL